MDELVKAIAEAISVEQGTSPEDFADLWIDTALATVRAIDSAGWDISCKECGVAIRDGECDHFKWCSRAAPPKRKFPSYRGKRK